MILVTGGAGYIGSVTSLALMEAGFRVCVLDDFSKGHRDLVFSTHLEEGDLTDRAFVDRVFDGHPIEAVIHFAAKSLVGESMGDPDPYYRTNLVGTINLLSAMRRTGVGKFVLSSTAAVYGEPESVPIPETALVAPTNVYGETKAFLESALRREHHAYGLKSVSLRYFNAAGADPEARTGEDHSPESHLIPILLDAALGRRDGVKLFGDDYPTPDGTCIRDYVHVSDLASAHVLALKGLLGGRFGCEAFNLGNGEGHSVRQVLDCVRSVTGCPVPAETAPRRDGDPARLVASSGRAMEILGWRPGHADLRDIVETAWTWHRKRFGDR
jgi:UDP-glucose 4-epimerase